MKKNLRKMVLICMMVFGLMASVAVQAKTDGGTGSWQKDDKGWWYEDTTGGSPANCWREIDGKFYFFYETGYMAANAYHKGYYLTASGAWDGKKKAVGWMEDSKGWKYYTSGGKFLTGWRMIDGKWYFFNADGYMAKGWKKLGGIWYYLSPSGAMVTGWKLINKYWYFFDDLGRMYSNAYIDQKYFLDENGRWDGVTITEIPGIEDMDLPPQGDNGSVTFTFKQNGWYVARLEVQVWDNQKKAYTWIYSDSCAIGQMARLSIDTEKYEIHRVGYQIWFFGWDNDYMNVPWANTDYAKTFELDGYGDYPEFTW